MTVEAKIFHSCHHPLPEALVRTFPSPFSLCNILVTMCPIARSCQGKGHSRPACSSDDQQRRDFRLPASISLRMRSLWRQRDAGQEWLVPSAMIDRGVRSPLNARIEAKKPHARDKCFLAMGSYWQSWSGTMIQVL